MIERDGNRLRVSGRLTMETVGALHDTSLQADGNGALEIDFGRVEVVDSAAVSLLLCWLRRAHEVRVTLRFSNLPENLSSLARLYGVAELLPVA